MRKLRKLLGTQRIAHIIKENNSTTIIKKTNPTKLEKIKIKPEQTPTVQKRHTIVNIEKHNKTISRVEPIWTGETVYIIGGGPSLINFNWDSLNGKKTIAINKAILSYPIANVLYWTDTRVYNWYKEDIDRFKGLKYTIRHHVTYSPDIKVLRKGNKFGLEESKDALCHGNNSGYAAINLAYLLGAKKIILLGYDMKNNGTTSHYHDGYPVPVTGDNIYKNQFIPGFDVLANLLKQKNVDVYNASLHSALTVWPKITFEQALSFR
jgi:hypothetical protein